MNNFPELLFYLVVGFLAIGHELDAIQQREWAFFFDPFPVSDETAYRLFVALHIPLFVWIAQNLMVPSFQIGFDLFVIAHAAVHWLLRNHAKINFNNWFSRFWIFGGAVLALCHLAILWIG